MKKSNPFNSKSNTKSNNNNKSNSRFSSLIDNVPETNVFKANVNAELKVNTRFDGLKDEPIVELSDNIERQVEIQGIERQRTFQRFNSFSHSNNKDISFFNYLNTHKFLLVYGIDNLDLNLLHDTKTLGISIDMNIGFFNLYGSIDSFLILSVKHILKHFIVYPFNDVYLLLLLLFFYF